MFSKCGLRNFFLPTIERKRPDPTVSALLLLDGHKWRETLYDLELAKHSNFLPPPSSHPLVATVRRGYFKSLKNHWESCLRKLLPRIRTAAFCHKIDILSSFRESMGMSESKIRNHHKWIPEMWSGSFPDDETF